MSLSKLHIVYEIVSFNPSSCHLPPFHLTHIAVSSQNLTRILPDPYQNLTLTGP